MVHTVCSPFLISVDDYFSVGASSESVPARLERAPELLEVVDLTVEDDSKSVVFVKQGLMSALEVDNAEAPHAESNRTIHKDPFVVGPAVDHVGHHAANGNGRALWLSEAYDATNATHPALLRKTNGKRSYPLIGFR